MKLSWFLFIFCVSLMGCGQQITEFVKSGAKRPGDGQSELPSYQGDIKGIKISPGANAAVGSTVQAKFAITTTNRTVEGNQVKAKISFSHTRPE